MKTPEEIFKIAEQIYPVEYYSSFRDGFIDRNEKDRKIWIEGYTACQEQMKKEIKEKDQRILDLKKEKGHWASLYKLLVESMK